MTVPLRLLLVEDSPSDAEMILRELRRGGFEPAWQRVDDEPGYLAALAAPLDLILSDYAMPQFSGLRALDLLQQRGLTVPFVIISGTIGDETAATVMKRGAADFVLKDRLSRLGFAVRQALEQDRLRHEKARTEQAIHEAAASMAAAQEIGNFGSWELELGEPSAIDRNPLRWSDQCYRIFGFAPGEIEVTNALFFDRVHPDDRAGIQDAIARAVRLRTPYSVEHRIVRRDGEVRHVHESGRVFCDPRTNRPVRILGTVHDLTENKRADESRVRFAEVLHGMTEACFALDANWRFTFVNDRGEAVLRHRRAEMIGRTIWEVFHQLVGTPMEQHYQRAMRDRVAVQFEAFSPVAHRWLDIRLFPSGDGLAAFLLDIQSRKEAELALRQSLSLYRTLVDASPDAVVATTLGALITNVSDQARVLFGLPHDAIVIGRNIFEFLVPGEHERARANLSRLLAEGRIGVSEYRLRRWDGSTFMGEINAALLTDEDGTPNGIILVARDITARLAKDTALRESETRFRQVVESIREVFWMSDVTKGVILYVSPGFDEIWGRPGAELYGSSRAWTDSIHPEDRARVLHAAGTKQVAGTYDEIYRIVRPDGSVRWIRDQAYPVNDAAGEVTRVVGVAEDITQRKLIEEQFLRAQRLEAVGTLASGIAHDLNNILTPILLVTSMLREKLASPRDAGLLTMVEEGARRGANIIRQLLVFSRGIEGERGTVQLRHLLKEMAGIARETFPREICVVEDLAANLRTIEADATQIHQVLMNLCVNARDAMRAGGTLTLGARNADLGESDLADRAAGKPGAYVQLTVSDTGEGIPPEILGRIFEPFFTTKEVGRGTGLGLSTVAGIVKSHGGFVTVESAPGRGTTFHVHLPASATDCETAVANTPASAQGGKELVLVVDDESAIRSTLSELLRRNNYRTLVAGDGREAMGQFLLNRDQVRLVFTDLMMPGMNGVALVRALRAVSPGLRILAASGLHDPLRNAELAALGVTRVLMKPCDPHQLLEAVRSELAAARG